MKLKKIRFNQLPIHKAIRGSKLSKRAQDEVLKKISRILRTEPKEGITNEYGENISECFGWNDTKEGHDYWVKMHKDSGL